MLYDSNRCPQNEPLMPKAGKSGNPGVLTGLYKLPKTTAPETEPGPELFHSGFQQTTEDQTPPFAMVSYGFSAQRENKASLGLSRKRAMCSPFQKTAYYSMLLRGADCNKCGSGAIVERAPQPPGCEKL
ncbi:hypothetical protein Baya_8563 [Bagarius yarrelli]|uniref:Uncharacterized protein n=1 Tax=Bagarius yarrelli TaxID=175774 RepID=A0A556U620_BAGYA|nr:hypothetical protein Baya_8563 [Bagarius yarrelli]